MTNRTLLFILRAIFDLFTGHAAMEMAVDNMIEPGDKVLVVTSGIWGTRFTEMATRHGGNVVQLQKPGEGVTKEEIEKVDRTMIT